VRLKIQKQSLQTVSSSEAARTFEIVAPIAPDSPESIHNFIETKEVPSGTVLIYQGKRVGKVQMIQQGLVMLLRRDSEGREDLVGLRSDGWYAGGISAILDRPSTYLVKTVTRCRTTQIVGRRLIYQLTQSPQMMQHFTLALCQEITSQAWKQMRMPGRAENDLDWQAVQQVLGRGAEPVPLFDQAELAQLLSLSPEHLCKLIYELNATRTA
jgi:CRP-like cAMP-binding protein